MKKFITIAFAVALTAFGANAAFAQEQIDDSISTDEEFTAGDCAERDDREVSFALGEFCLELALSENYPPTTPVTTATTTTTTTLPDDTTTSTEATTPTATDDTGNLGDGGEAAPSSVEAGDRGTLPDPTTPVVAGDNDPDPVPLRQGTLPRTGGSGSSNLLQGGALMLIAGAVIFVLARRRSTAPAA
jgi:LPXTG-motif cell wall-anchored protein